MYGSSNVAAAQGPAFERAMASPSPSPSSSTWIRTIRSAKASLRSSISSQAGASSR